MLKSSMMSELYLTIFNKFISVRMKTVAVYTSVFEFYSGLVET